MSLRSAPPFFATVVTLALLLLAGCADEPATQVQTAAIGDRVRLAFNLEDGRRAGRHLALGGLAGEHATVLMAWSVSCPCIEAVEARVQRLYERLGVDRGVAWIGIDGDPGDTREQVREKLLRLASPYPLLLDPSQAACRRLGLTTSSQVAILDGEGRLAYRGALDDNLATGEGGHVAAVLEALLEGRTPPHTEQPMTYGCDFGDPEGATRMR